MAKDLGTLVARLALDAQDFVTEMGKAESKLKAFGGKVADAVTGMVALAAQAFPQFAMEATHAFLEAEKASLRLGGALARVTPGAAGYKATLEAFADATERATGVDGDFIKGLQQLAVEFRVQPATVNRATKAAVDFAEATGGSARQALQLFTSTNSENTKALEKWGIVVSESDVKARGLAAVLEKVEATYGGTASQIHESSKALAAQSAAWGDLKEAVGGFLVEMLRVSKVASFTTTAMDVLAEGISKKTILATREYAKESNRKRIAIQTEIHYIKQLERAEQDLENLRGTADEGGAVEAAARARVEALRDELSAVTRARKEMHGMSGAMKITLPEMDLGAGAREVISKEKEARDKAAESMRRANAKLLKETIDELNDAIEYLGGVDVKSVPIPDITDMMDVSGLRELARGMSPVMEAAQRMVDEKVKAAAKSMAAMAASAQAASAQVAQDLANRLLSGLGDVGGVITNAINAGMAGGPMAALASVGVDLLMKSETFQRIAATLGGLFQSLADIVGKILEPVLPLIGALGLLLHAFMPLVGIVTQLVDAVVTPLVPIFVGLASILEGLMPVIMTVIQVFLAITNPLLQLGGPVMKALFGVLRVVGIIILTIAKALGDAWNWIVGAVQSLLDGLSGLPIVGGLFKDAADGLERFKANTAGMETALNDLKNMTWDVAQAKAKEAAAAYENYKATKKATEELTNVPAGWKRALRTFQAQDPQDSPFSSTNPGSWEDGVLVPGSGGSPGRPPGGVGSNGPGVPGAPGSGMGPTIGGGGSGVEAGNVRQMGVGAQQTIIFNGYDIHEAMAEAARLSVTRDQRVTSRTGGGSLTRVASLRFAL